jgi:hypothetical protein
VAFLSLPKIGHSLAPVGAGRTGVAPTSPALRPQGFQPATPNRQPHLAAVRILENVSSASVIATKGAPELGADTREDDICHADLDRRIMAIDWAPAPFSFQPTFIADDPFYCRNLRMDKFGFRTHFFG